MFLFIILNLLTIEMQTICRLSALIFCFLTGGDLYFGCGVQWNLLIFFVVAMPIYVTATSYSPYKLKRERQYKTMYLI